MYRVEITGRAEADLEKISVYLEEHAGYLTALRYIKDIRNACENLAQMPFRFRERTDLGHGRHMFVVNPYLVFYRVVDDTIYIQRILHGRRKITAELFD